MWTWKSFWDRPIDTMYIGLIYPRMQRTRRTSLQARADRALRSCLKSVSGGRLSGAAAKAKLGLYDLSGIRIDKDLRKIIDNL